MTDRQQAFLRKAQRGLEKAKKDFAEKDYDFAISRAYYSMFHAATALLLGKGLSFSKHSAVIGAFGLNFAATGEMSAELHRYLIDAQDDRLACDYLADEDTTILQAESTITHAEAFLDAAKRALNAG